MVFQTKFSKTWIQLAPLFYRMVTQMKENYLLSPHLNPANISDVRNVDLNIIWKTLAKRLQSVKGRHSTNSTLRLIDVFDYSIMNLETTIVS